MTRNRKITEKDVEAIYNESQRKIAKVPGYAEAFDRLMNSSRKLFDNDGPLIGQDKEQFDKAIGDLMFVEFCQRFDIDPDPQIKNNPKPAPPVWESKEKKQR